MTRVQLAPSQTIRLSQAKPSDISSLVQIYLLAFESNLCIRLAVPPSVDHRAALERGLAEAISEPKSHDYQSRARALR